MILVDMNQIGIANVMMHLNMTKASTVDGDMVRHMILNSLRMYRERFHDEYGEMVICYDSKHYWRRDYFPQYKMNRKKVRDDSSHDWDNIFECLNAIKEELTEFFPYKVVEVYGAEADDIIGVLCAQNKQSKIDRCGAHKEILILSGDKDFIQLQSNPTVAQYSPITKKMVHDDDPCKYLRDHIMKGDTSDGVPNILSPDNTFTDGLRQRPLGKNKIAKINHDVMTDEVKRNHQRNTKLIDLSEVPEKLSDEIMVAFNEAPEGDRSKLLNYFIDKRLKNLMESIGDF